MFMIFPSQNSKLVYIILNHFHLKHAYYQGFSRDNGLFQCKLSFDMYVKYWMVDVVIATIINHQEKLKLMKIICV